MYATKDNWDALLSRLGVPADDETYDALVAAHGAPDRHYHTLAHIDDCLGQLAGCGLPARDHDPIALALWFHDAVYDWRSTTNEADSARWAVKFLEQSSAPTALSDQVVNLIMATCHTGPDDPEDDCALIVDIDLSILGRPLEIYDRYETAIRAEYQLVPEPLYKQGRRKVLQEFLDRPAIFATEHFIAYEAQARQNLARAIAAL